MKNWWYYYKWYVICGIVILGAACSLIGNALGLWKDEPDFQIAYVGRTMLPEDTASALKAAFSDMGDELDFNGDGKVTVGINQYISSSDTSDPELAQYAYASEISLMADINDCESYFFLLEDADKFQKDFHVLARLDGSCPDEPDYGTEDKTVLWADCPTLAGMELGSYSTIAMGQTITGSSQELLAGFAFGRRCFYTERRAAYAEQCGKLWDLLTHIE